MEKFNDYEGFVEKFKPKKTTDDCYTPPYIYEAVLKWVRERLNIPEDARIVRPFYPGGDYENFDYRPGDVVVDNPPFSIVTQIRRFYVQRGIAFFLFAPHLTLWSSDPLSEPVTFIVTNTSIIYENGANVNTDFVTNMWPDDDAVVVCGDLNKAIKCAQDLHKIEKSKAALPKYNYPPELITSALLGKIAERGININFPRRECHYVRRLDSQIPLKKAIFGNGFLISERLAAERLAAVEIQEFPLSEREWQIVRSLSR